MSDNACGSCVVGHNILSAMSDCTRTRLRWRVDRTRRPSQLACTIPWPQSSGILAAGTRRGFGVFSTNQWLRGITAPSTECLSGESSETRNFRQSAHLCATKSCKLCWNTWETQGASHVGTTRTSPVSQQTWLLDKCWLGIFVRLIEYYTPPHKGV
jgi:hypothetical protein